MPKPFTPRGGEIHGERTTPGAEIPVRKPSRLPFCSFFSPRRATPAGLPNENNGDGLRQTD